MEFFFNLPLAPVYIMYKVCMFSQIVVIQHLSIFNKYYVSCLGDIEIDWHPNPWYWKIIYWIEIFWLIMQFDWLPWPRISAHITWRQKQRSEWWLMLKLGHSNIIQFLIRLNWGYGLKFRVRALYLLGLTAQWM